MYSVMYKLPKVFTQHPESFYCKRNYVVTVLGAATSVGSKLSFLLKQNPRISVLSLYDDEGNIQGYAKDLSLLNTKCKVQGFVGEKQLTWALSGSHMVIFAVGKSYIGAGGKERTFNHNAAKVQYLALSVSRCCPWALIGVMTEPINSIVPVVSNTLMNCQKYDPTRIFGMTALPSIRAATLASKLNCSDPARQFVPVVGGDTKDTIIPLLSYADPPIFVTDTIRRKITTGVRVADSEVSHAKCKKDSGSLAKAYAGARFVNSTLRAMSGELNVIEIAYVRSCCTSAAYFSSPVLLGSRGVCKCLLCSDVSKFERKLIDQAVPILKRNIKAGEDFVNKGVGPI